MFRTEGVSKIVPEQMPPKSIPAETLDADEENEIKGLRRLAGIDAKPNECHGCGRTEGLKGYNFGLAKVLSAKRDWTEIAASVALSAISVPLVGLGMIKIPGKKH